ncbi:MAG: membrane protein insertase YidC [Endomicrobiales bacterium]|nr:membrane protein insertase YidC [Endomicrobiales bacterium]
MERNTILAVLFSTIFLIIWWTYFTPKPPKRSAELAESNVVAKSDDLSLQKTPKTEQVSSKSKKKDEIVPEKEIIAESNKYKAVFTTRGAAIKHWFLKEKNDNTVDLVLDETAQLSTFDDLNYKIIKESPEEIAFEASHPQGYKISKTYFLSQKYLHRLAITIKKEKQNLSSLPVSLTLGPGLGADDKEKAENLKLVGAIGLLVKKQNSLEKFKHGDYSASDYKWVAMQNRYFLAALIPENPEDFGSISVQKENKKTPPVLTLSGSQPENSDEQIYLLNVYFGPKAYYLLKGLPFNLDKAVDFGWVSALSKIALKTLSFFYKLTGNYGWAIVMMTICLQVLVFPLTIKSFKAQAAMKQLQPLIKELQQKYKDDPKRLNVEMLNLYKTQKVNPLGGCLPMLLQLPIFWALFSTLRNAYELRGAPWIFWIKDLSHQDPYFILPILMGLGMLFQQKLVSVSADPAQARMMYLMPIIFTVLFLKFPAGLVLYWLTNSLLSMTEQYFILHRPR